MAPGRVLCKPLNTWTRPLTGLADTLRLLWRDKRHQYQYPETLTIDVQKMNWKFSTGVHEQTGVCLHRHCGHNGTGGYTREPQNTGQFCDCQSFTHQVATGLPQRRCAFGAADHGVDRPPRAPRALGGPVRALGPQCLLSLRLAEGLSAAWPGEFVLPP